MLFVLEVAIGKIGFRARPILPLEAKNSL